MKPRDNKDANEKVDPMQRMNEALKAALKTPPRKHKDEPKRAKAASAQDRYLGLSLVSGTSGIRLRSTNASSVAIRRCAATCARVSPNDFLPTN